MCGVWCAVTAPKQCLALCGKRWLADFPEHWLARLRIFRSEFSTSVHPLCFHQRSYFPPCAHTIRPAPRSLRARSSLIGRKSLLIMWAQPGVNNQAFCSKEEHPIGINLGSDKIALKAFYSLLHTEQCSIDFNAAALCSSVNCWKKILYCCVLKRGGVDISGVGVGWAWRARHKAARTHAQTSDTMAT